MTPDELAQQNAFDVARHTDPEPLAGAADHILRVIPTFDRDVRPLLEFFQAQRDAEDYRLYICRHEELKMMHSPQPFEP